MSGKAPWYASMRLADADEVRRVRERVWNALGPPGSYERSDPHLTVHPGFSCDQHTAATIAGVLAYAVGEPVGIDGMSFHPGPDNPMVVKLDVDADLSVYRQAIESHVLESGGTIDREPVPPHITLFKCGDAGDEGCSPMSITDDGLAWARSYEPEWTTDLSGYTLSRRS